MGVRVAIWVLPHGRDLELPGYQTPLSAGCDLRAAVEEPVKLDPGARVLVRVQERVGRGRVGPMELLSARRASPTRGQ